MSMLKDLGWSLAWKSSRKNMQWQQTWNCATLSLYWWAMVLAIPVYSEISQRTFSEKRQTTNNFKSYEIFLRLFQIRTRKENCQGFRKYHPSSNLEQWGLLWYTRDLCSPTPWAAPHWSSQLNICRGAE